jgi:hypothetical protein
MSKHLTSFSIVGKALNAYAQARRHNATLPKPVTGEGKAITLGGKLVAVLPMVDGSVCGYAAEPTYRLVKLSPAQIAPYQHQVKAPTPHERVKRLLAMLLNEMAVLEQGADEILAELTRRLNAANGNGHGAGNGRAHPNVADLAEAVGVHLAAE